MNNRSTLTIPQHGKPRTNNRQQKPKEGHDGTLKRWEGQQIGVLTMSEPPHESRGILLASDKYTVTIQFDDCVGIVYKHSLRAILNRKDELPVPTQQ